MSGQIVLRDGQVISPEGCEVNATEHCNLACRTCSHLSPALRRLDADPDEVFRDLSTLARSFRPAFVKVLGGEPLLHRDLLGLLAAVRESRISDRVVLSTNGLRLPRMGLDFWRSVDEVIISEYPGFEPSPADYEKVAEVARAHDVSVMVYQYQHFRESYSELGTTDEALVRQIFSTCKLAHEWYCHTVYKGHFFMCPQSIYLPRVVHDQRPTDGIEISGDPGFPERLYQYIQRPEPLRACGSCLGSVGNRLPHRQESRRTWRDVQQRPTEALLDRDYLAALLRDPHLPDGCAVRTGGVRLRHHLQALRGDPATWLDVDGVTDIIRP